MASLVVRTGDCLEHLAAMPDASVDAIATDPPYGLGKPPPIEDVLRAWLAGEVYRAKGGGFMGREWDAFVPGPEVWREVYRVAKPGAHLVCFAGTRTQDVMGIALRLAGWVIRDVAMFLFGSGFPKNLDVSKAIDKAAGAEREVVGVHRRHGGGKQTKVPDRHPAAHTLCRLGAGSELPLTAPATPEAQRWEGWGTALKPAYEPIIIARKPLVGSVASNVLEYGTGGINVDGCRVGTSDNRARKASGSKGNGGCYGGSVTYDTESHPAGRWPANVILGCACDGDHDPGCAVAMLDEQSLAGGIHPAGHATDGRHCGAKRVHQSVAMAGPMNPAPSPRFGDTGGAARFFYTAKSSREEREAGLSGERSNVNDGRATSIDNPYQRGDTPRLNTHPTVKPLDLMRWLVRLVTPPGGTVLDPFTGSGTTGCAAAMEGFDFLGFEMDEGHAETARQRIAHWSKVAEEEARQVSLFDEPKAPSPLGLEVQQLGMFDE